MQVFNRLSGRTHGRAKKWEGRAGVRHPSSLQQNFVHVQPPRVLRQQAGATNPLEARASSEEVFF